MRKDFQRYFLDCLVWGFRHETRKTNATFWRRATRPVDREKVPPLRWHWLAGWQRLFLKQGAFMLVACLWWWTHPDMHAVAILAALVLAAGALEVGGAWWLIERAHFRDAVGPLHDALVRIVGAHDTPWKPGDWLTVPKDYREEGTSGTRVQLPAGRSWPSEVQAQITEAVSQKLGITDVATRWALAGAEPHVTFKPVPQAPRSVDYRDIRDEIERAPDTAPVIGRAKFGRVVSLDLEDDSPHILISAGSGGGKSVLARALIAQFLARGARVVIFDRKRISHRWAKDLPGVEYYRDTEAIHDALVRLQGIGDVRNRQTDDEDRVFQRIVVVFEEMNATTGKLTNYWAGIREKDDPKRSPALEALGDLVNMGRQVQMHVIAIGQRVETRTLGGGDVRESFGIRCLTRYTVQTWKMLCADVWPAPRKSSVRGRWQIVTGGEATETQVAFLTDDEARALATSRPRVRTGAEQADTRVGTPDRDIVPAPALVSLRGHFGDDYDRRRKQLQRDPASPRPSAVATNGADLYQRVELIEWATARDSARATDEGRVNA